MFIHHETVPHDLRFQFAHLAIWLRRLYQCEVHRVSINCHVLVLTLAPMFNFKAVHGYVRAFDPQTDMIELQHHSWMVSHDFIIDAKPNGCVAFSPLLISMKGVSPLAFMYQEDDSPEVQDQLSLEKTLKGLEHLRVSLVKICQERPVTHQEIVDLLAYGAFS